MSHRKPAFKFAVCINHADYPASLELHKLYRVLPDEDAAADGDLRVVDESGEDYLYPAAYFVFVELPRSVEKSLLRAAYRRLFHGVRIFRSTPRLAVTRRVSKKVAGGRSVAKTTGER